MKDPLLINASSPRTYYTRYNKEIKLNSGAKEIYPPKHQAPPSRHTSLTQHWFNVDSTSWWWINVESMLSQQCVPAGLPAHHNKTLSLIRHRVWSQTHRRAIKEESKVAPSYIYKLNLVISCFENNVDPDHITGKIYTVFLSACKLVNEYDQEILQS